MLLEDGVLDRLKVLTAASASMKILTKQLKKTKLVGFPKYSHMLFLSIVD